MTNTRIVTISYTEAEFLALTEKDTNTMEQLYVKLENELFRLLQDKDIKVTRRELVRSNIGRVVIKVTAEY